MPTAKTKGRVYARYVTEELALDEPLKVSYVGPKPNLIVLGVDRAEGVGMGEFVNRWHYVLTWTD